MEATKAAVRGYWDEESCGEVYASGDTLADQFTAHAESRYLLEPYIEAFAGFDGTGKAVLEVGVGMGADHIRWAMSNPQRLAGVDFSPRAIRWTAERLHTFDLSSELAVADAETLPFPDNSFDLVYSWGVLHHTPNTQRAFHEVRRVLRPRGEARIMVYHRPSLVGLLLWAQYGLRAGRFRTSLKDVYSEHLESPGTKGFTLAEGRQLAREFSKATVKADVGFADLLNGEIGSRHRTRMLHFAKSIWPRPIIRRLHALGLLLTIRAAK
jgi:ubiquinone/menaquinone biosynthesis C-methylase UbiE